MEEMVSACSQVSIHDCENDNVGNLGVAIRAINRVECVGSMRVASLKRHQMGGKDTFEVVTTCFFSLNKSIYTTPMKCVLGFLPFLQSTKGHMHNIKTIGIGRHK